MNSSRFDLWAVSICLLVISIPLGFSERATELVVDLGFVSISCRGFAAMAFGLGAFLLCAPLIRRLAAHFASKRQKSGDGIAHTTTAQANPDTKTKATANVEQHFYGVPTGENNDTEKRDTTEKHDTHRANQSYADTVDHVAKQLAEQISARFSGDLKRLHARIDELTVRVFEKGREYSYIVILSERMGALMNSAEAVLGEINREDHKGKFHKKLFEIAQQYEQGLKSVLRFQWFYAATEKYGGAIQRKYLLVYDTQTRLAAELEQIKAHLDMDQSAVSGGYYGNAFDRVGRILTEFMESVRKLNSHSHNFLTRPFALTAEQDLELTPATTNGQT